MDKIFSSWIRFFTTARIRINFLPDPVTIDPDPQRAGYRGREDKELVSESQCATNSYTQYLHSADSKYVFLTFKFKKKINVTRGAVPDDRRPR